MRAWSRGYHFLGRGCCLPHQCSWGVPELEKAEGWGASHPFLMEPGMCATRW